MFYPSLDHSTRRYKHTHVLNCKFPVVHLNSSLLSPISQPSAVFTVSISACFISDSNNSVWADWHCTLSSSSSSCTFFSSTSGVSIDRTLLTSETMSTLVWGSKIISLPNTFQCTTSTLDPPGFTSVVLTGTDMFLHLGHGSTNTWTCFWCPVTLMSPFTIIIWKAGTIITVPFTWSRSNSLSLICNDLNKMVLMYANFQDYDNDFNLSSIRLLTIWSIILLPTWNGTLLW